MDDEELERYYHQKEKPIIMNNRYLWKLLIRIIIIARFLILIQILFVW